jgi:hypothetical protein
VGVCDRPLTEREREVLLFLTARDDATAAGLRRQIEVARVLQDGECCASFHLSARREDAADAPAGGHPLAIEATLKSDPNRIVRLVTSGEARLSQVEITHDDEAEGPRELPPPEELNSPTWWEWQISNAPEEEWPVVPWAP